VAGEGCNKIDLPANAHLDYSGNGWACHPGFTREGTGCIRIDSR
jgi:hypothetical protein